jgi:tetratricopeptide (TPR) repeat protein
MEDRPQTREDRRADLNNRLQERPRYDDRQDRRDNRQGDRQDWRENNRDDWQDWKDNNREDWQDWYDDNYWHHGDWYHGGWGHGEGYWNHMWDEHPVSAAVGLTWWGANRASYWMGYSSYYNPYWTEPATQTVVNYSEPIVISAPTQVLVESAPAQVVVAAPAETAPTAPVQPQDAAPELPPGVTQKGVDTFDLARSAFYQGNYTEALKLADDAVAEMPKDGLLHEFRSLVLFSLKRYRESAAAIHAVLAVGPGWDWTTMSGMFASLDTYTEQLRALEAYRTSNPDAAEARFLLAYHYLTAGHTDEAATELRRVVQLQPKDHVASELLQMITPPDENAKPKAGPAAKPIDADALVANWSAKGPKNASYSLRLTKDGDFTWSYGQGSKKQEVKGVYAIDGNSLAMEIDGGGAMVADLELRDPNSLHFDLVGASSDNPGLDFKKSGD